MTKTIVRITVIIFVMALVAGGIYWAAQNNPNLLGLQTGISGSQGQEFDGVSFQTGASDAAFEPAVSGPGARPEGFREGDRSNPGTGFIGIGRNLLTIGAITLAVIVIQKTMTWLIRSRRLLRAM